MKKIKVIFMNVISFLLCAVLLNLSLSTVIFASDYNSLKEERFINDSAELTMLSMSSEPEFDFSMTLNFPPENESANDFVPFSSVDRKNLDQPEPSLYNGLTFTEYRAKNQSMDVNNLKISFDNGKTIELDDFLSTNNIIDTTSGSGIQSFAMTAAALPDLYITDINISQGVPILQAFKPTHVEFRMYNNGPAITTSFDVAVVEDRTALFGLTLPSFPASTGGTLSFDFANGFAFGSYNVLLIADALKQVQESNENNNLYGEPFSFSGIPDLTIEDFKVVNPTGNIAAMDEVTYGFTVVNSGNAPATNMKLEIFINNQSITPNGGSTLPRIEPFMRYRTARKSIFKLPQML